MVNRLSKHLKNKVKYALLIPTISLFSALSSKAQTTIAGGWEMHFKNGAKYYTPGVDVTNGNIKGKWDIINYGDRIADTEVMDDTDSVDVEFAWTAQQIIGWTEWTNFHKLVANNLSWIQLANTLNSDVQVRDTLKMLQWILDLNGQTIDLWSTGNLSENDTSYTFDNINNGKLNASAVLNNPVWANPGNLWLDITGGGNMDTVRITRSHMDKLSGAWSYLSYEVLAKNQPSSDVFLTISYLPQHLHSGMWNPWDFDIYQNNGWNRSETNGTSDAPNNTVATVVSNFGDGLTIGNPGDVWDTLSVYTAPNIENIKAFPNPTAWWLTIQLQTIEDKNMLLQMFDIHGKQVHMQDIQAIEGISQHNLNLNHLANGVYMLQIENKTIKVVVAR